MSYAKINRFSGCGHFELRSVLGHFNPIVGIDPGSGKRIIIGILNL